MPLSKSKGQMYQWATHCHSHIGGKCPHSCSYCFVQKMGERFPVVKLRYQGEPKLSEKELQVKYGTGKVIFIEHMNDICAPGIKDEWIEQIINHCRKYDNAYIFQTKNPGRLFNFHKILPYNSIVGTTIESNRTD